MEKRGKKVRNDIKDDLKLSLRCIDAMYASLKSYLVSHERVGGPSVSTNKEGLASSTLNSLYSYGLDQIKLDINRILIAKKALSKVFT